jgi:DNA invertase Pin-like site-specific DNA recombinase
MHAVLYRRVSTQEQGQSRNGLEGQLAALQAFCAAEGIEVAGDYVEVASGKHGPEGRPLLRQALDAARRTGALLLVSKLDRLSRSVEFVSTLMNNGPRFATVEDGLGVDPFMLHLKASLAEKERAMIGERTKAALAALKARGVVLGWASHKEPSVSRSKALCRGARSNMRSADAFASSVAPTIMSLQASGRTLAEVADELNKLGVRTARGGKWYASTVCNLLQRVK